jgi:hypothetical protein
MALVEELSVFIDWPPSTPLGGIMGRMRRWLDENKIQPAEFKIVLSGPRSGFEVRFKSASDAERFREESAVCQGRADRPALGGGGQALRQ